MSESHFPKEMESRQVICLSVRQQHAHPIIQHKITHMFEELLGNSSPLQSWFGAQPDKLAVLPGGLSLFYCGAKSEAHYFVVKLSHQAKLRIALKKGYYLVLVPGPIEIWHLAGCKDLFTKMKNIRQVINLHLANDHSAFLLFF